MYEKKTIFGYAQEVKMFCSFNLVGFWPNLTCIPRPGGPVGLPFTPNSVVFKAVRWFNDLTRLKSESFITYLTIIFFSKAIQQY